MGEGASPVITAEDQRIAAAADAVRFQERAETAARHARGWADLQGHGLVTATRCQYAAAHLYLSARRLAAEAL